MLVEECCYLATPHPYKGLRVYTVEPQGLKGASEHGSERLSRIFGEMERKKQTVRHADGIYVLGNTPEEVLVNMREVFNRGRLSGLTFKPQKVVTCLKVSQLFGWVKKGHEWSPTNHVISPLSTAPPPKTVKALRGWLRAFKQVSVCVPNYAVKIGPLETAVGGRASQEKITWTSEMLKSFDE